MAFGDTAAEAAFEMGFRHGKSTGFLVSRRVIKTRFPAWSEDEVGCYLNGREDGVAGDSKRLFLMAKQQRERKRQAIPITYSNPRMEAVIDGWPFGSKWTTATFRIETVPGRGQRGTRVTIDPKTGKPSAVKKLTYAPAARIVDGSDGRTYIIERTIYGFIYVMRGDMKVMAESIPGDDPRYAATLALFNADGED